MITFTEAHSIVRPLPENLDALEQSQGIKLPPEHRDFLIEEGGGEPQPNEISFSGRHDFVAFICGFRSKKPYLDLLGALDFWGRFKDTGYLMIGANHPGDSWLLKVP